MFMTGPHGLSKSALIKEIAKKKGWKIKVFKVPTNRKDIPKNLERILKGR